MCHTLFISVLLLTCLIYCCCVCIYKKVDDIDKDATTVKELYDLIETYKVPTPPEDLAVYQVGILLESQPLCGADTIAL